MESGAMSERGAGGIAFLLAQLGAHATARYTARVAELALTPAQTGVLRLVWLDAGLSQQALAGRLGVVPSKVVALVDELEGRGLVERRRGVSDRRTHALHLTEAGQQVLRRVSEVAVAHEASVTAGLADQERHHLRALLQKVADVQGLTRGVHPGYGGRTTPQPREEERDRERSGLPHLDSNQEPAG